MHKRTILLAEDDPIQRRMVKRMVETDIGCTVLEAEDGVDALELLKQKSSAISLVLVDLNMPRMTGVELLHQIKIFLPNLPFIVLTASEKLEDAVEAMQLGAVDFITKPAQRERIITSIKNAIMMRNLQDEVTRLKIDHSPYYSFEDIVTITPSLDTIIGLGRKAASSDMPILITGESGVGKEVFAHAIHLESKRAGKPFISVNCGALPENLVESTLFGHEKGSFTGATSRSIGKCREADGGVLFLDEVGELKPEAQVKLLRLLQEGEIEPVGSTKPVKVDVRIISATNRSLEQMITAGRFREDLYYRLHGFPLHIPSLKERKGDIIPLAHHMLGRITLTENRPGITLSKEAELWLSRHNWPGNVRELQHLLSRAVLLANHNVIEATELSHWAQKRGDAAVSDAVMPNSVLLEDSRGNLKTLEVIEQEVIQAALIKYSSHIGRAAAALGVGQSTLYKKMKRQS